MAQGKERQEVYKVDSPFKKPVTSYDVCRAILSSQGSSQTFSCTSRLTTRPDLSRSISTGLMSTRDVALDTTGLEMVAPPPPPPPPPANMKPQRVQTKVRVRRIKAQNTIEEGVRPDACNKVEPVGESFIRFSMENVPRWFFGSKAKTFWGSGRDDRKLNLVRLSTFDTPPSPPEVAEPDLIAHRIPPTPKLPPSVQLPPIDKGEQIRWNSLPMESDLDKYLKWLRVERGRQGAFTRYVGAVEPGKYRTMAPTGRAKQNRH